MGSSRSFSATPRLSTTLLGAEHVAELLRTVGRDRLMDTVIARLADRLAEHDPATVQVRDRDGFRYDKPALGLLEWMPTHEVGGPTVVKLVGYHPTNPLQRGLPSVIATSAMWDSETGHLVAFADATLLTAIRTGAASAVATDLLAATGPIVVGIVGLGAQAVTQLHAISRVREIDRVVAIDVDPTVAATFARRVEFVGVPIEIAPPDRAATIVGDVDVVCTCTSVDVGAGPVVAFAEPRPGLHVNAVGADFPGKLELPRELLARAVVIPDTLAQCLAEGECQQVDPSAIGPSLFELVQSREHAHLRSAVTVFDSTGWAVEDDVALRVALELAGAHGIGVEIALEHLPDDPYDPYFDGPADPGVGHGVDHGVGARR